jgi:hypothetical protein
MNRKIIHKRLAQAQIGVWRVEWQILKQRDHIDYLQGQRCNSSRARGYLRLLIDNLRWYEREIERLRNKLAE